MNLISSRLCIFLLSPMTSASLNLTRPITSVSSLPFICFVPPVIFSGLQTVFHHCLAGWRTCKKMQIWVIFSLCMRIYNWREQGNGLPESRPWKRWNCYLQHKKLVMRTGGRLPPCRMETCRRSGALHVIVRWDPLCSQGICRTWQTRVLHSLWRESGEEWIRLNGVISQSKSREGKMRISPSACTLLPSNSVVDLFFFKF